MNSEITSNTEPGLDPTGERYIPSMMSGNIVLEHMHRYIIASELVRNKAVLDIACGEGYGSNFLADAAKQVFAVDISEETILYAKNKYKKNNLEFKIGQCSNIPLPDHSVDVVVSFETIEHHTEHEKMMAEIHRVLRPQGILIISSPDKHEYSDVPGYNNPFHFKELYRHEFEALLSAHFTHIKLFGQRVVSGSSIVSLMTEDPRNYVTYSGDANHISKIEGINKPLYFIAIASDGDLPQSINSFFEGAQDILQEKDSVLNETTELLLGKDKSLHEANLLLQAKDKIIHETNLFLQEKEQALHQTNLQLQDKDKTLHEANLQLQDKDKALHETHLLLQEKDNALRDRELLLQSTQGSLAKATKTLQDIYVSTFWRITSPLRKMVKILRTFIKQ